MKGVAPTSAAERLGDRRRQVRQGDAGSSAARSKRSPPCRGRRPTRPSSSKWFGYLKRQEAYLRQITAQLRAEQTIKAQRLTARFIHNGNLANNVVLAFGFDYCSFKFSRYG